MQIESMSIISTTLDLKTLCKSLQNAPYITVDTEFLRDKTYYSELCLLQVAAPDIDPVAIDPLAEDIDLAPFYELMQDKNILKVFHAARQDLEIFYNQTGKIPSPIFDTQVAAMVCGYGDSIGYLNLVNDICQVSIDKGPQFTDWSQRPLSDKQVAYALDDVKYLRTVYEVLVKKLEDTGRIQWVKEEMGILTDTETYENRPEDAWKRVKIKTNKPRVLAVLQALSEVRELEAQRKNVPRSHVIKSHALADMAIQQPKNPKEMKRIRHMSVDYAKSKTGKKFLQAIEDALKIPDEDCPEPPKRVFFPYELTPVLEMLKMLLRIQSSENNVAAKLIADTSDLEALCMDDNADILALKGWRYDVFGKDALALKSGKLSLALHNNKIVKKYLDDEANRRAG